MQDPEHVRLLALEADAIFGLEPSSSDNSSHRVLRDPTLHALLIWSSRGVVTALSRTLATQLADDPDGIVSQAAGSIATLARFRLQASSTLAMAPAYLVHLQDALGLPGHAIAGGPTWIVPDALRATPYSMQGLPRGVRIVTSLRDAERALVTQLPRPVTWHEAEWAQLLAAGTNVPWAMAIYEEEKQGEVVCLCHTPARNAQAAEAGVWTRDDWRGQGLAPRTVAAWATTHAPDTTTLFYSAARENAASQAVARKLGLREFGYIWKLLAV